MSAQIDVDREVEPAELHLAAAEAVDQLLKLAGRSVLLVVVDGPTARQRENVPVFRCAVLCGVAEAHGVVHETGNSFLDDGWHVMPTDIKMRRINDVNMPVPGVSRVQGKHSLDV